MHLCRLWFEGFWVYYGILSMVYYGILRYIIVYYSILWHIMVYYEYYGLFL